jgi:hypothetical protein
MKLPPAPDVDLALWRELYDAACRFQALASWTWMSDYEVFGVDNEHGVRISCVLGANRELLGLVSYRGTDGVNELLLLRSGQVEPVTEFSYRQDALLTMLVTR